MLTMELVAPQRLPEWLHGRAFSILFLVEGSRTLRPKAVYERLDVYFPGALQVGTMSRDAVASDVWWLKHWVTELGPIERQQEPALGLYLFHRDLIVGHHPATAAAGTAETWAAVREYLIERIRLKLDVEREAERTESRSAPPPRARAPAPAPSGPYALLEIEPTVADDAAKLAYRRAVKLNHPDKVAHMSEAIQRFAHDRMLLINAAWEAIRAERGMP